MQLPPRFLPAGSLTITCWLRVPGGVTGPIRRGVPPHPAPSIFPAPRSCSPPLSLLLPSSPHSSPFPLPCLHTASPSRRPANYMLVTGTSRGNGSHPAGYSPASRPLPLSFTGKLRPFLFLFLSLALHTASPSLALPMQLPLPIMYGLALCPPCIAPALCFLQGTALWELCIAWC